MVVNSTVAESVPEPTQSVTVLVTVADGPRKHSHAEATSELSMNMIEGGGGRYRLGVTIGKSCLSCKALGAGVTFAGPCWTPYAVPV